MSYLSTGDLPDPGIEPTCILSPALAGRLFTVSTTWEALHALYSVRNSWTAVSEERVPSTEVQGPVLQHSDFVGRSEERAPSESS